MRPQIVNSRQTKTLIPAKVPARTGVVVVPEVEAVPTGLMGALEVGEDVTGRCVIGFLDGVKEGIIEGEIEGTFEGTEVGE